MPPKFENNGYKQENTGWRDSEPTGILPSLHPHKELNILIVFGTRPEAIKLAPVIERLHEHSRVDAKVCVTAQHRDMLDQALALFGIEPDYDLNLMQENQSLSRLAASILSQLESVLQKERPDWIVVQGDTTTAAVAALAGFYQRCRVAHVEAGLRSHDKWQPFPEEINRHIAGLIADIHFAPTEGSKQNLLREGVPESSVRVTGNTIIDALQRIQQLPWDSSVLGEAARFLDGPDAKIDSRLILVTAHRRENFGEPIANICEALRELADRYPDVRFIYPVHRNPNIWEPVHDRLRNIPNIALLPPLDYLSLVQIMKRSFLVLTDSGGIQEEAPALGVPALVLREVTERPEGVAFGNVKLVGCSSPRIIWEAMRLLEDPEEYSRMARAANPYGDGHAAERIAQALVDEAPLVAGSRECRTSGAPENTGEQVWVPA